MLRKGQEESWQFEGGSLFISQPDVAEREAGLDYQLIHTSRLSVKSFK